MTVTSKVRLLAAALALTATAFAAGETRSQTFTLEQLETLGGTIDPAAFPLVLGNHVMRARFFQKRSFTVGDGSRHTLSVFRAWNCWLREKTVAERATIICGDKVGPGVFIPVLFVTPASRSGTSVPVATELELRSSRANSYSLMDYAPLAWPDNARAVTWVRLRNPQEGSLALTAPAVPAALVLCVPVAECERRDALVANLDDTPVEQRPSPPLEPAVPRLPPAATAPNSPAEPASPAAPPLADETQPRETPPQQASPPAARPPAALPSPAPTPSPPTQAPPPAAVPPAAFAPPAPMPSPPTPPPAAIPPTPLPPAAPTPAPPTQAPPPAAVPPAASPPPAPTPAPPTQAPPPAAVPPAASPPPAPTPAPPTQAPPRQQAQPVPPQPQPAPPQPAPAQPAPQVLLHYVVRPAANSMLTGWTPQRMASRLLTVIASSGHQFLVKTGDGKEVNSSSQPELARSGDAVVVWSGEKPEGQADLMVRGPAGIEIVPRTQSAQPQAAPAGQVDPGIRTTDLVSFAEFRIAVPFLYDRWQARIDAVTKIYGQEVPDTADDLCKFSILIPRIRWLPFLAKPVSIGLDRTDQDGRRILVSPPEILSAQLMGAAGEPLQLDVQRTDADPGCISQTKRLAPFITASGTATAAWKLSEASGNPSMGRMDIRPSSLTTRGRFLLGLYAPRNIGAGTEALPQGPVQDQIFNALTTFLDSFHDRNFRRGGPAAQATGADLALIDSADGGSTAFSEKRVILGKFRQPSGDGFKPDPEGNRRLSAFLSAPNPGGEVSFRAVGQTVRHYARLFGDFSGEKPPIVMYVGASRPAADSCLEWKKMTADVASLSGRPRVFAVVFANASADQISRQLGQNGRREDEPLVSNVRGLTCGGDSGPSLLFIPSPALISQQPKTVLEAAFNAIERWAGKIE